MRSLLPQIIKELDITKPRSDFEFETFFLGQYPTPARQMIAVMEEILKVSKQIFVLENTEVDEDEEFTKKQNIINAKKNLLQLEDWYQGFTAKERELILKKFEGEESEYWVNVLGKRAAIEVLAQKHISTETMNQLIKLPRELFETATSICNEYINMVTTITEEVENSMENFVNGVPEDC